MKIGPRQANLVLIAYASSEGSGEPAHPRSLARTFAARSYKQWIKRNLQTENQIPGPSEWLGMRSWNLSWRNARIHKFAWRGSIYKAYCPRQYTCVYMYCLYTISWHRETVILGLFYYKIRWQYSLTHVKIAMSWRVFILYFNITVTLCQNIMYQQYIQLLTLLPISHN